MLVPVIKDIKLEVKRKNQKSEVSEFIEFSSSSSDEETNSILKEMKEMKIGTKRHANFELAVKMFVYAVANFDKIAWKAM